jgi:hypothetical protein
LISSFASAYILFELQPAVGSVLVEEQAVCINTQAARVQAKTADNLVPGM